MTLTLAEAAWKRLALDTVREEIAELLDQEYELERDLGVAADPLAPLPFNVIDLTAAPLPYSQPAEVVMPPMPTLQEADAVLNEHISAVAREAANAGVYPLTPAVIREAVARLTTAERHVLKAHPFLGGAE